MQPGVSVVVRSRNEEKTIRQTLEILQSQSIPPREIILVDNESRDRTREIALASGCKVVCVRDEEFTHAFSCNLGAAHCSSNLIVFTNGHSYPVAETWLARGMSHFSDPSVAGVYGPQRADGRASIWERGVDLWKDMRFRVDGVRTLEGCSLFHGLGLLSTVNCFIRRDLWTKHPFDEEVSALGGGEDSEWGFYYLRRGYRLLEDRELAVLHCHGDRLLTYARRSYSYYLTYFRAYAKNRSLPEGYGPYPAKKQEISVNFPDE